MDIRAGSNGGAFISEVDMDRTKESLANFLHFKNVSVSQISEIRKVLEPFAARSAASLMSDEEIAQLVELNLQCRTDLKKESFDELRRNEVRFHRTIANATRNPILILILDFIENLLEDVKKILKPDLSFSRSRGQLP